MNIYTLRVPNVVIWTFCFWLRITGPVGHLKVPLCVGYISNIMSALHSLPIFLSISLCSLTLPLYLFPSPVAAPQTSCASIASSIMRTCRRSPSTLWFVMLMPQDSRLERHNCHRGIKHTKKLQWEKKQNINSHFKKMMLRFWDIEDHLSPQVPVSHHGPAGWDAAHCSAALWVGDIHFDTTFNII